jgi:glycosyltransferase involved in cell wall biosynthesis
MPATAAAVTLSIVVPVYNSPDHLGECVTALMAQAGPDTEVLVVDDASTDDTPAIASASGARVLRLATNSGPAAARNHGASRAQGELLFFVDADVVIASDAVATIRRLFSERPDVAAVFGSYDDAPRAVGLVSRYRNLLHHFVHQNADAKASTFWAGCGAIRRAVFHEVGGFDAQRFQRPSIEDIELGRRLRRAGHTILLEKTLQGTHLKRWTLVSMIRTDITQRALPWSRLTFEESVIPDTLNLRRDQRLSAVLVGAALVCALLAGLKAELAAVAAIALGTVVALNRTLYGFFLRRGGLAFAVAGVALHLLYFLYSGVSYVYAWLEDRLTGRFVMRGRRSTVLAPPSRGQR